MFYNMCTSMNTLVNMARPYPVGVASGLATVISETCKLLALWVIFKNLQTLALKYSVQW